MSQTAISIEQQKHDAGAVKIDMKLEVALIPVSDVGRAKEFYTRLGWRLDSDDAMGNDFRIVQLTPPGSGSSVSFGKGITSAAPGAPLGGLIVTDIEAAHKELVAKGINVSEVFHGSPFSRISGPDPERKSYGSYVSFEDPDGNVWIVQEVTRRLPGRIDPATTTFGSANDLGKRAAARGSRPRRPREAQRPARRELAGLVRSLHGGRAGRNRAAEVSKYRVASSKEKETTLRRRNMTIQVKEMKTAQMYRADSAPQAPNSALRGRIQRLGLILLAFTLVIGLTGSASASQAQDEAAVRALGDNFAKAFVQKNPEQRTSLFAENGTFVTPVGDFLQGRVAMVKDFGPEAQQAVTPTTQAAFSNWRVR